MNRKNIYLMYAMGLLQGMVFYGPVATLYRQAQGVSVMQIALIESISLALCILLELPWGMVADRIGYRRTLIFCFGLDFASKIVFWQASGFADFLVERIMLSVVISGLSGVETGVLYLSCPRGQSHHVFGVYSGLQTTGMLLAALVFSTFIGSNYKLAGFLTVISYGMAALLSVGLTEVHPEADSRSGSGEFFTLLGELLHHRSWLLLLVGVAFLNETHQMLTVFLNQPQYVRCGLSPSTMGYIYIAVTLIGLCGVFSARLTTMLGVTTMALMLYGAAVAACVVLAFTGNPWLSVGSILVLRMAFSLFQPLQTELQNRRITTANRATALSIQAVIIDSVGVGTSILFGVLSEYSLAGTFLLGGGLCAVGAALFMGGYHPKSAPRTLL